jgi:AraC-like DNA-binding protein
LNAIVAPATPRAIVGYLRARGRAAPPVLQSVPYSFDQVVALWEHAEAATGDPLIGLRVAGLVPRGAFGVIEHLMSLSSTLELALRRMVRFYPLVNQALALSLEVSASKASIALRPRQVRDLPPCYADFVLASVRRRLEWALLHRLPHALVLPGVPPATRRRYAALAAASVAAGEVPAIVFDRAWLRAPLPAADEESSRALEAVAEGRLRPREAADDDAEVRRAISERMASGTPQLPEIAVELGLSGRTLQRRLLERGTTFRALIDEVRRQRTLELLAAGAAAEGIAEAVGFAEPRSFRRAFRRWLGTTPGAYRHGS